METIFSIDYSKVEGDERVGRVEFLSFSERSNRPLPVSFGGIGQSQVHIGARRGRIFFERPFIRPYGAVEGADRLKVDALTAVSSGAVGILEQCLVDASPCLLQVGGLLAELVDVGRSSPSS